MSGRPTDDGYRVWHPWTRMGQMLDAPSLCFTRADGSYLYTEDGRRYLDACAGMWNVNLGHGRPDVIRAISQQLQQLTYLPNIGLRSAPANRLAMELLRHAPPQMRRVMFHCTGTAAVEGAVLLCRQYFKRMGQPGRVAVISLAGAYHGCSLLCATLSGNEDDTQWFAPLPAGFHQIPLPDDDNAAEASIAALRRLIANEGAERFAAFVFEPVLGLAGGIVPPAFFVEQVLAICQEHSIKVIADEVVTGLGRCGTWFAAGDPRVDAIVLGKGLSAGYVPLAATLYSTTLTEPFEESGSVAFPYGSTMDGFPAACAGGLVVLQALETEGLVARAQALGPMLLAALRPLQLLPIVQSIRGRGLLIGLHLCEPSAPGVPLRSTYVVTLVRMFAEAGMLVHPAARSSLLFTPPLSISDTEVKQFVAICLDVLPQFARHCQA